MKYVFSLQVVVKQQLINKELNIMNKRLSVGLSVLSFGAITWFVSSCETLPTPNTGSNSLEKPNLPATLYDYSTGVIKGSAMDIKAFLQNNAVNKTGGFGNVFFDPSFGAADPELMEAADKYSNASVQLGRVLFYDKKLSLNNMVSCGSCHHQKVGFSDAMASSIGFGGQKTSRNSMAICNPIFFNNMFWDSRAAGTLDLSTKPVFNHIEMGMENDAMLEQKLAAVSYYPALFTAAFGDDKVTRNRISMAISHFLSSMITGNSKFDAVSAGSQKYTELEQMGHDIFFSDRARCSRCHAGDNLSAPDMPGDPYGSPTVKGTANIGLERQYKDPGKENGNFRIPSLRNIELTGPYMHDGRFANLNQVIDHYSHGVQPHSHLDKNLKDNNGNPVKLNFSELEKDALIAFLRTLTDNKFITDPRFSDPFAN